MKKLFAIFAMVGFLASTGVIAAEKAEGVDTAKAEKTEKKVEAKEGKKEVKEVKKEVKKEEATKEKAN